MSEVVLLLRIEHQNMSMLLDVLERQLTSLERGDSAAVKMASSVMDYFRVYPDRCHHPKEDLIFRTLASRDPSAAQAVGDLLAEHRTLTALGDALAEALADRLSAPSESPSRPDRIADLGWAFLASSRRHMEEEDRHFLPAALRVLSDDDWEEIEFCIFDTPDPLFSEPVERRFRALLDDILAHAGGAA